jgi:nucleoside-diphosphate-sugar epimerase
MEIVGRGFLAGQLAGLADRHAGVVVLAAGVSRTQGAGPADLVREQELVRAWAQRGPRDGRLLVVFSTASHAMYGSTERPASEATPVRPSSTYGRHKLALEQLVADAGSRWLVVRLAHVIGPGQRPHLLFPALIAQIRAGTVRLYAGAHRDLIDVADVVPAIDTLLTAGVCGEVLNMASGDPVSVAAVVDGIEARLGCAVHREIVPATPVRTVVSAARLRALVDTWPPGGPAHLDRLLDRYLTAYTGVILP